MGLVTQSAKYMPFHPTIHLRAEISKLSIQAAIPVVTVLVGRHSQISTSLPSSTYPKSPDQNR